MKLKVDGNGHVVVEDGKPVYVHSDGKEVPFDAEQAVAKISQLNGEAKGHREKAEQAIGQLKAYDGLDAAAARTALDTVSKLDHKQLIDAGKVDEVRAEVQKVYEGRLAVEADARKKAENALSNEMIGGNFSRSKFVTEKLAIPPDLVQSHFGRNFAIEDGKVVATDSLGNKVYSRAKPGELATFDEAMEVLVENYPYKDSILKSTGGNGSGSQNNNQNRGGKPDLSQLPPVERMNAARGIGKT